MLVVLSKMTSVCWTWLALLSLLLHGVQADTWAEYSSGIHIAIIVGSIIGGIFVIVIVVSIIALCCCFGSKDAKASAPDSLPSTISNGQKEIALYPANVRTPLPGPQLYRESPQSSSVAGPTPHRSPSQLSGLAWYYNGYHDKSRIQHPQQRSSYALPPTHPQKAIVTMGLPRTRHSYAAPELMPSHALQVQLPQSPWLLEAGLPLTASQQPPAQSNRLSSASMKSPVSSHPNGIPLPGLVTSNYGLTKINPAFECSDEEDDNAYPNAVTQTDRQENQRNLPIKSVSSEVYRLEGGLVTSQAFDFLNNMSMDDPMAH